MIFGSSGAGDQSVFEIVVKTKKGSKKISLQSIKGQAELTALSAVLHTEELMRGHHENAIYFSHQLHQPDSFFAALNEYQTITVKTN